jgi:urease accessory protein
MVEIKAKLKIARSAYKLEVKGQLKLPFESRQKNRLKTMLASGEEVALMLPRGEVLRGGDLVTTSDGRVIEVVAAPEALLHIESGWLARIAYHLGERHVPVQVGEGFLRVAADHALEEVVKKLGAAVKRVEAPFEPEAGAGSVAHDHDDDHHHHSHGHEHHRH